MEQLAPQVGPHGQAGVPQKGQYLAVDGQAGPAQHESGHGQPPGEGPAGEGGHPGGDLPAPPVSSRSAHTWERPSGAHSRARSRARPVSSPERVSIRMVTVKNRIKAQMFSAEARGAGDRPGEGGGEPGGLEVGLPAGGWGRAVPGSGRSGTAPPPAGEAATWAR